MFEKSHMPPPKKKKFHVTLLHAYSFRFDGK